MSVFENLQPLSRQNIPVSLLLESPGELTHLNGVGLENKIGEKNLHRPQLALTGYVDLFTYHRVQILGNTEVFYLRSLDFEQRLQAIKTITRFSIPCVIITNNHTLEPELIQVFTDQNIACFVTPFETTKITYKISEFLDDQFAPQVVVHGSFVDVYGVGMIFAGRSGIGKSEIAMDLVERGHRLVADDVVMITKKRDTVLLGTGTNLVQHFMEIRGIGIIDIRQMFGVRAIRFQKRIEIIIELEDWDPNIEYSRLGLDTDKIEVMGVDITSVKLPIFPGKNITVIAEVIALNYLLRTYGYNAAKVLTDRVRETIKQKASPESNFDDMRIVNYFHSDDE